MENFNQYHYQRAKEKVEAIKGFYGNALAYIVIIPLLFWLNYRTTSLLWAVFPAIGWGLGLLFNGLNAYGWSPFLGKNWEQRKIQELMKNDKNESLWNS